MVLSSLVRWGHRLCSDVRRNHGLGSLPGWEEGSAQQSGRAIGWALLLCRVVGWALQWAVPSAAQRLYSGSLAIQGQRLCCKFGEGCWLGSLPEQGHRRAPQLPGCCGRAGGYSGPAILFPVPDRP